MKVFLVVTNEWKKIFRTFCSIEQDSGYYSHNPKTVQPLELDFLPAWVPLNEITVFTGRYIRREDDTLEDVMAQKTILHAGGSVFPEGVLYCSSGCNWITLSNNGECRVGGRRHGIPFLEEQYVVKWRYPVGGTLTPNVGPFDHPKRSEYEKLASLAKRLEVEKVKALLDPDLKAAVEKTTKLKGYRLERAKSFLKGVLKEAEYTTLFPS